MNSINLQGGTQITLQFDLDRNIDAAAQDVLAMIAKAARQLLPDMPNPPIYQKVNPADQPILYIALSSPVLPLSTVNEYADTFIAQRISMISGVAQVLIYGSQKYAVRIQLNPNNLVSRQIGIDEVASAVRQQNVNLPTGLLSGPYKSFTIEATGNLTTADASRPIIVVYRNGRPVRLEELGNIIDSVENDKISTWYKDARAIVLAIQRQPGTNTVEIVDNIHKLLSKFKNQIPASVDLTIMRIRGTSYTSAVWKRIKSLRICRSDHVDRNRQEKCHYDDRLCDFSSAYRRNNSG
ncbi:MAG: hypothetical protein A2161_20295 [Candidatus Schekmanbacteria bacterium RBG_13_48_7]|uniref:Acriflavine resistance protein B n=1 Tax=Candidatus Schekmanbacteria bacterium RBG_13_48_7 TaxID=1817878 RepID=A0A1F7RIE3_9BACT|nr:MAG: hypothetical protein A2161_20295 [Candidatus Schekmanbacteria bacterium RBG_13_48_7]